MPELSHLSHDERVFLAGCIRTIMLADGGIEDAELKDLDRIRGRLGFDDYEECLDEFEAMAPDEGSFLKRAAAIRSLEAQDLILKTVYELTVQNGAPTDDQESIFLKLSRIWKKG
jgi:hypothetical protein